MDEHPKLRNKKTDGLILSQGRVQNSIEHKVSLLTKPPPSSSSRSPPLAPVSWPTTWSVTAET